MLNEYFSECKFMQVFVDNDYHLYMIAHASRLFVPQNDEGTV